MTEKIGKYVIGRKLVDPIKCKWDILIMIDSCRYDKFEKYYRDILGVSGLKKAITCAVDTIGWFTLLFKNREVKDTRTIICVNSFIILPLIIAPSRFYMVIDAWKEAYDYNTGIIDPLKITNIAIKHMYKHPEKRLFIRYEQPHFPFISLGGDKKHGNPGFFIKQAKNKMPKLKTYCIRQKKNLPKQLTTDAMVPKIWSKRRLAGKIITILTNREFSWKLDRFLGIEPPDEMGRYYFKVGKKGIIKAYEENVKIVLKHIRKIMDEFPNKEILILSDHGFLLGEYGGEYANFSYPITKQTRRKPEIITVPWLEIRTKKES
jgi:hypothetical protein